MVEICWLGQGGFLIESDKYRILLDPYMSDCVFKKQQLARLHQFPLATGELKPDLLLISHDHMDHFDPEGVPEILAAYPDCRCAGPQRAYDHFKALDAAEKNLTLCTIGQSFTAGPFKITAIPAFHSDPTSCGYCIETAGKRIVITGDTVFDEGLFVPETERADLLLICINGKLGNMNDDEALQYVKRTMPRSALPMHIGLFAENSCDPQNFIRGCGDFGVNSFEMTPGKSFAPFTE